MSEEITPSAGAEVPANVETVATPVEPPATPAPEVPTVPETPSVGGDEERAPEIPPAKEEEERVPETPWGAEGPAPEAPEEPVTAAAEQSQPKPEVSDALVEIAVSCIKATRKSSSVHLQKKLNIDAALAEALLDVLTAKSILGEPNGAYPRKILIECDPPKPKPQPAAKPAKKKKITDEERLASWKEHLRSFGKYEDEELINVICEFAQKNPGFTAGKRWSSCLIVMMNRLSAKLRDSIWKFTANDAEFVVRELLRFLSEQPLGDGPQVWNAIDNKQQKDCISQFFGIDKSFRELRGKPQTVMTAVRDAAWPNFREDAAGTGGSYGERFHYMAMCIVAISNGGFQEALFSGSYHTEPTEEFQRKPFFRQPRASADAWIVDGKCSDCGSDITTDSRGNQVCSSPICPHHFARTGNGASNRGTSTTVDSGMQMMPEPGNNDRRRNWKGKGKKRSKFEDGDMPRSKGSYKRQRKFRENDGDEEEALISVGPQNKDSQGGESISSGFACTPFEGLSLG